MRAADKTSLRWLNALTFRLLRGLRVACVLLLVAGPVTEAAAATFVKKIPQIKRLTTFQFLKGEKPLRSPLALARDAANGDLVVTSFETGEVVILDQSGAMIKRMGPESGLRSPYGVAIDQAGRIYVSELQSGLLKIFAPAGLLMDQLDLSALRGRKVTPGRVMIGGDQRVYVADLSGNELLILNRTGELLRSLGPFAYLQKGGPISGGRVLGLSGQGAAVTIFDREGEVVGSFGKHGDEAARNVSFPAGFAVDSRDRLWIADAFQHRLKVFALDGTLLFNYGRMEEQTGGFFFPVDLCFGAGGELYVLEKGAERIQVFQIDDLVRQDHD